MDIFKLDKIFFPVNQGNQHWNLIIAFMQEKRIQYYDSMGGLGIDDMNFLLNYFKDEHLERKHFPLPNAQEWKLVSTTHTTPRQPNGYDCGVYTCMFACFLSCDMSLDFGPDYVTEHCRTIIGASIIKGSLDWYVSLLNQLE